MAAGDVGAIANVATALTLLAGLLFGVVQITQQQRRRRDEAAVELIHSFQDQAFVRGIRIVWRLPVGARARDVAGDSDTEDAATQVANALTGIGYMVYRRVVPMDIADELMGNTAVVVWARLERWVRAARRTGGTDDTYRWFEWFVREVRARRGPATMPAVEIPEAAP